MKIVYCSNAGHTKEYALLLAKKLNIECLDIKNYKIDNEKIIFMGWVFGDMINGYKNIDKDNLVCVVAVGMNYESKENTTKLIEVNNVKEKLFYLQGGLDYKKLKGIKKLMIKMVAKSVTKNVTLENEALADIFKNGGYFVNEKNLSPIIGYIKNIRGMI